MSHIHVTHAAHAAAGHAAGCALFVLRELGHHRIGGEDERRDRSRVLQRVTGDLGGIENAHRHHVAVLARLGVVAEVALAFGHLVDDHRGLVTRVAGDLAHRLLERAHDDLHAGRLVFVVGLDLRDRVTGTQQGDTTARNDAFLDGGTGRVQRVFHAGLLLLHLDFGRGADLDHRNTAGELRHALLQLFLVVVAGGFLDLLADRLHARLDGLFLAGAVDDGGVLLAHLDALGAAERLEVGVLELEAQLLGDHGAAGEDRDVLEHGLAAVAEARGLDGAGLQDAAQVVHHEGRECLAVDVFGDDQQRTPGLGHLLEHRQEVTDVRDLLVVQQDERVFQDGDLLVRIVDEVRRDVAAVELHAFDEVELVLEALAVFHGDDAFLADLVHRLRDGLADLGIRVGGDGADLGDLFRRRAGLADLLQLLDGRGDRLVDAALQIHRVHAGGDVLHAFGDDRLREHGRGGGAVTGDVGSLGSDFLHQLGAHVLELVLELDLLCDRHAVLGDGGGAERALEDHVAALRAEGDLDRIGQDVHARDHANARVLFEFDVFGCHGFVPLSGVGGDQATTAMMSSSRITRSSSPSTFTVVPEYLPNRTLSPTLRSTGLTLPSSFLLPGPTASTSPWSGFSAAVSGMTMPEAVLRSSSSRLMITRSCSGRSFIGFSLHLGLGGTGKRRRSSRAGRAST